IGSSTGSFTEVDLLVLEPSDEALPFRVSLVEDGFFKDSDSLVLHFFVFLPWFGTAGRSSSSSSYFHLWSLTMSATPLSIAFSSSIKAFIRAWYNLLSAGFLLNDLFSCMVCLFLLNLEVWIFLDLEAGFTEYFGIRVSLVEDGFFKDSDSLVLHFFVFLPWFGTAGRSSSSSSYFHLWSLTMSATPLSIAFSSSIKASIRAWYNLLSAGFLLNDLFSCMVCLFLLNLKVWIFLDLEAGFTEYFGIRGHHKKSERVGDAIGTKPYEKFEESEGVFPGEAGE
nr:hypothetical protein [Tanacetum cinerariifolium]